MPAQEQILYPGFTPGVCDFCAMVQAEVGPPQTMLVYIDPETRCQYCLACLRRSRRTRPMRWEETDELGFEEAPDPAITTMSREIIADLRKKKNHARN